jgi:hypothetical protein
MRIRARRDGGWDRDVALRVEGAQFVGHGGRVARKDGVESWERDGGYGMRWHFEMYGERGRVWGRCGETR